MVPQDVPQVPVSPTQADHPAACEANCAHHRPVRLSWAKLLKRVFEIGGCDLKTIAAILERPMIEKILMHLGLQVRHRAMRRPYPAARARGYGAAGGWQAGGTGVSMIAPGGVKNKTNWPSATPCVRPVAVGH